MTEYKIIKQEHIWTSDFKLNYLGYGEWVEEVDSVQIEYRGYRALVCRAIHEEPFTLKEHWFGGHLCGYVVIPHTHPYFGKGCKEELDIECHGGITFNEAHENHLIGFDCGHSGDICPSIELFKSTSNMLREFRERFPVPEELKDIPMFNPTYKNTNYCICECMSIIDQLIEIEEEQGESKQ